MAKHFSFTPSYLGQLAKGTTYCSSARALEIEAYTKGAVTRADLLPHKWQSIWPDFAAPEASSVHAMAA